MNRTLDTNAVIRPARFAHVVLRTRHIQEAISWYETVLGMAVVFRNDFVAFLTFDEEHHRLALVATAVAESPAPGAAGMDHIAYTLSTLGELLGTYKRLKAKGIVPVWTINHGLTTSMYYADPDGSRVELQVDNFASEAELKDWMKSGAFAENPIGVEFDADKLVARFERGDPLEQLVQQGAA